MIPCSKCGHDVDDLGSEIIAFRPEDDAEDDYILCCLCRDELLGTLTPINWTTPLEHLCWRGTIEKGPREDCCEDRWVGVA